MSSVPKIIDRIIMNGDPDLKEKNEVFIFIYSTSIEYSTNIS